jgi:PIN domain nuclease of toxin-antitoxin system
VKILLDTHAFLWFIEDSPKLSTAARSVIEDGFNEPLLSVASLWEMAIKVSIGKLDLKKPFETFVPDQMDLNGFDQLAISFPHIAAVAKLPFHHRDPFDRLLVAQALVEGMPVVSADDLLDAYGVTRLW